MVGGIVIQGKFVVKCNSTMVINSWNTHKNFCN
jgi:hypothetical protein